MGWIESHTVLLRHRKLVELAQDLRLAPVYVMGHLHALWHVALEQQEDGDLSSWSDQFIADMASFPGDAPQFVRLLQRHEWLDGKLLHDWLDYAGKYLTAKYRTANPKRLRQILFKHKSVNSRSKVGHSPIRLGRSGSHKVRGREEGGVFPDWLSADLWQEFRLHRKRLKDPLTAYGEERAIAKLTRLKAEGNDVREVIQQSLDGPWKGLFAVKKQKGKTTGKDIFSALAGPLPE